MISIQGHRGCRGLMPENSIPSFIKAIELGCDTIELDVTMTGDDKILISHDPFLHHEFCLNENGQPFLQMEEKNYNFYQMTYDQIKEFDCGTKPHPRFPEQENFKTHKPLLSELVSEIDQRNLNVRFNIEIKSTPNTDHIFHPPPEKYANAVLEDLQKLDLMGRSIVQSFDPRILEHVYQKTKKLPIALLVENGGFKPNLAQLSFLPDIYAAHYSLVDKSLVQEVKAKKMKLFAWTANSTQEMSRMINLNIDGIITDYPDRLISLL